MTFEQATHITFFSGVVLGVAGIVAAWFRRPGSEGPVVVPPAARWAGVAAVAILVALFQGLFRERAHFLIGADEYYRVGYAYIWAHGAYLAPDDHIWLAGQFYILGGLCRLFDSMRLAVAFSSCLGVAATAIGIHVLATRVSGSSLAGVLVASLALAHPVMLWSLPNPVAEVFFFPAMLGALAFMLRWWESRDDRLLLVAAACIGFGNMFRYESWYFSVPLGLGLLGRWLWLLRRPWPASRWLPVFFGGILVSAYPIAWMVSSAIHLGSPLKFLQDAADMNRRTNLFYDFSSPFTLFWAYPKAMALDHGPWLPLPLAGLIIAFMPGWRRFARPMVVLWAAVFLFAMLVSMKVGLGSNNRSRYTMFLLLPGLVIASLPLAALFATCRGRLAGLVMVAATAACIASAAGTFRWAVYLYPNAFGIDPNALALLSRLEVESTLNKRDMVGPRKLQPKSARLVIYTGESNTPASMFRYHSHWGDNVFQAWNAQQVFQTLQDDPAGTRLVIFKPRPEGPIPPRAKLMESTPTTEVWVVKDQ